MELFERIKKNPLSLAETMQQKNIVPSSELFSYCIFSYIKENPNLFITFLRDTHIDERVETEYINEESIALKFQEQSCRTNFSKRGLSSKHDIEYVYKIYNPKQLNFINFELCAMKINSNPEKILLWGNKVDDRDNLSIFELMNDNTINEITEGPLKEILKTTTTRSYDKFYNTLEDIIDEETYITIENNNILTLHHKNQQQTFSIYKRQNVFYSDKFYSDKNKYIVEYEGNPTILSYDYLSERFILIKLNDILGFVHGNLLRFVIQDSKLHVLYKTKNKNYLQTFEIVFLEEQAILNDNLKIYVYFLENDPKKKAKTPAFTISEFFFLTTTQKDTFKLIYNNPEAGVKEAFAGDRILPKIPYFISEDWFWLTLLEDGIPKNYLFLRDNFLNSFLTLAQSNEKLKQSKEKEKGRLKYEKFVSPGLIPKIPVSLKIKNFFNQIKIDKKTENLILSTLWGMFFGTIGTAFILKWYQNKYKK